MIARADPGAVPARPGPARLPRADPGAVPARPGPARLPRADPGAVPARPDLRVVPGGRPRWSRAALLGAAATVVTVLGLFGAVASHVALTQGQFRLERLQSDAGREQQAYDRLRLQVAELEAPDRVVDAAKERLGMVEPGAVTYLTPPVEGAAEPPPATRGTAAVASAPPTWPTGWSTVKPHLAGR